MNLKKLRHKWNICLRSRLSQQSFLFNSCFQAFSLLKSTSCFACQLFHPSIHLWFAKADDTFQLLMQASQKNSMWIKKYSLKNCWKQARLLPKQSIIHLLKTLLHLGVHFLELANQVRVAAFLHCWQKPLNISVQPFQSCLCITKMLFYCIPFQRLLCILDGWLSSVFSLVCQRRATAGAKDSEVVLVQNLLKATMLFLTDL